MAAWGPAGTRGRRPANRVGRRALLAALAAAGAGWWLWGRGRASAVPRRGPAAIRARGHLLAGVPLWLPPFGAPARQGGWTGLDVALAQRLAAAVTGDATRVRLLPLLPPERLWAVRTGEADAVAAAFAGPAGASTAPRPDGAVAVGPYFTDHLELLVRRGAPVARPAEIDGGVVGVLEGGRGSEGLRQALAGRATIAVEVVESAAVAAAEVAVGRLRAFVAGRAVVRALATYDPELSTGTLGGLGMEGYWLLLPAGDGDMPALARRAIADLPAGAELRRLLGRWAGEVATPWPAQASARRRPPLARPAAAGRR